MVGITSYGIYIPPYRLSRDEIARAWNTKSSGGERAVARYDEDSLTMAVDAAFDCIKDCPEKVDGLFFASTTSPYREKLTASIISAALDLPRETRTADFTDSLRSATIALNSAVDTIKSGTAQNIIVVASDCRMGAGKSQSEQLFGDGSVALAIGKNNVIASIEGSYSTFSEILDSWRIEKNSFVQSWEERFVLSESYVKTMEPLISEIITRYRLNIKELTKIIFYAPDNKSHSLLAKRLGFELQSQVQATKFELFGNLGTAALPMMLVSFLEEAQPNNRILVANFGDGGDAFILKTTEQISKFQKKRSLKNFLMRKKYISYERYLTWRELVPLEEPRRPESKPPSISCIWRDRKSIFALYGNRCKQCGTVQYPPQRICVNCQSKDKFEDYKLSDKKGIIFNYAIDYLTSEREIPAIISVVDFEGGGRIMCEITECEPSEIDVDMPVEMCFRKLGDKGGINNYFWKARPII